MKDKEKIHKMFVDIMATVKKHRLPAVISVGALEMVKALIIRNAYSDWDDKDGKS